MSYLGVRPFFCVRLEKMVIWSWNFLEATDSTHTSTQIRLTCHTGTSQIMQYHAAENDAFHALTIVLPE